MTKLFGLSWRTTLAGLVFATGNIVNDYLNGTINVRTFAVSLALAIAGWLAKDAKVTGTDTKLTGR
jgi:hypothetical protein